VTLPATVVADILKKAIAGSVAVNSKTYDGTTAATGAITLSGVIAGDSVAATASFAFDDKNAGAGKVVTIGGGSLSGADAGNYSLALPASVVADILKRAITVAADAQTKTQGTDDPALTYAVTDGSLVSGETLSGSLSRTGGEAPGSYAIEQGTLTASTNYQLTFVSNQLTIEARPASQNTARPDEQRALLEFLSRLGRSSLLELRVVDEREAACPKSGAEAQDCGTEAKISLR
jgi:hypothetical protein